MPPPLCRPPTSPNTGARGCPTPQRTAAPALPRNGRACPIAGTAASASRSPRLPCRASAAAAAAVAADGAAARMAAAPRPPPAALPPPRDSLVCLCAAPAYLCPLPPARAPPPSSSPTPPSAAAIVSLPKTAAAPTIAVCAATGGDGAMGNAHCGRDLLSNGPRSPAPPPLRCRPIVGGAASALHPSRAPRPRRRRPTAVSNLPALR